MGVNEFYDYLPKHFWNKLDGFYELENIRERSKWERTRWQTTLLLNIQMAKGKKITIMKKNAKLRPKPPPARTAILKSRRINVIIKKPHLNCSIHLVLIGISKDQLSGHYFLVLDQYELQLLHIHFLKDDL